MEIIGEKKGKHSKLQLLSEAKPGSSDAVCFFFFETCLDVIHEVPSVHKKNSAECFFRILNQTVIQSKARKK